MFGKAGELPEPFELALPAQKVSIGSGVGPVSTDPDGPSAHGSDAGDGSALGMNPLELLGELVEGHEIHPVGAGVSGDASHVVGAVASDVPLA